MLFSWPKKEFFLKDINAFFISYDEPGRYERFERNKELLPHLIHIDGVEGFDQAYKTCAKRSKTNRFVTIDGDNLLRPEFFVPSVPRKLWKQEMVFSWPSMNSINGLCYGNGGVKCWTKKSVMKMQTHENASDSATSLDFHYEIPYYVYSKPLSETHIHGSAYQSFRAGFREGLKMSLCDGLPVSEECSLKHQVPASNFERLQVWCNIGSDVINGLWAIYGACLSLEKAYLDKDLDLKKISDYRWFDDLWRKEVFPQYKVDGSLSETDEGLLKKQIEKMHHRLNSRMDIDLHLLEKSESKAFKKSYQNHQYEGQI